MVTSVPTTTLGTYIFTSVKNPTIISLLSPFTVEGTEIKQH